MVALAFDVPGLSGRGCAVDRGGGGGGWSGGGIGGGVVQLRWWCAGEKGLLQRRELDVVSSTAGGVAPADVEQGNVQQETRRS